jgi:hypothetical protein
MHALEDKMFVHWNALGPVLCRCAPSQKDDTAGAYFGHSIYHLLREELPAFTGMRVCLASSDSEAGVQEQNTTVCPWGEQTALVWRGLVVWVVDLERFVYILESVCLVWTVVRVLASDDYLDSIQWCVPRPIARISYYAK